MTANPPETGTAPEEPAFVPPPKLLALFLKWQALFWVGGGLALLAGAAWLSESHMSHHHNPAQPPPEVALAIITGAAVAIERTLEMFWTLIDMRFGAYWPLNDVNKKIDARVENFKGFAQPYFDGLTAAAKKLGGTDADAINTQIANALDRIPSAKDLAHLTNNERLDHLAVEVSGKIKAIVAAHPNLHEHLGADLDLAEQLAGDAKDFLADFKDNPIRRIFSIYAGSMIGILVATVAGVEIFGATDTPVRVGDVVDPTKMVSHFHDWAVPLTGIVIGLGSNPTHEIIAALKQYKDQAKT